MQIINGKLLGDKPSKSNETKQHLKVLYENVKDHKNHLQRFDQIIQDINFKVEQNEQKHRGQTKQGELFQQVQAHLQRIEQRCDHLEINSEVEVQPINTISIEELKRIEYLVQKQNRRIDYLEVRKLNKVQQSLTQLEEQTSSRLVWIAIISSIAIATVSIWNWLSFRQLNQELTHQITESSQLEATNTSDSFCPYFELAKKSDSFER